MTEQDAREALRERLAEALGAEMYQALMESTADAWRLWEYLTPAAKDRYRADARHIIADALLPAVEEYAAERVRHALSGPAAEDLVWDALDDHGHNGIDCRPEKPMDYTARHVLDRLRATTEPKESR